MAVTQHKRKHWLWLQAPVDNEKEGITMMLPMVEDIVGKAAVIHGCWYYDFRWSFDSAAEAKRTAERLSHIGDVSVSSDPWD